MIRVHVSAERSISSAMEDKNVGKKQFICQSASFFEKNKEGALQFSVRILAFAKDFSLI